MNNTFGKAIQLLTFPSGKREFKVMVKEIAGVKTMRFSNHFPCKIKHYLFFGLPISEKVTSQSEL